jgi:Fe2+ transport system protein FeoA
MHRFSGGPQSPCCDLNAAPAGRLLVVHRVAGEPATARRLHELGLFETAPIKKVSDGESLILQIGTGRVAISRKLAALITVVPIDARADQPTSDRMMKLTDLKPGAKARIVRVAINGSGRQRLLEMGLTAGVQFELVRFAPLGDPLEIRLRGYHLSLRRREADLIVVDPELAS